MFGRTDRSHFSLVSLLVLCSLPFLSGCGDHSSVPEVTAIPDVSGAVVPEIAEEGEEVAIEVWGVSEGDRWLFERFDVRRDAGNVVTITPIGRVDASAAPAGQRSFRGIAFVDAPAAGDHTIRIRGARRHLDFPMHVVPRDAMVRLVVRGGPEEIHEELAIGDDGWAMAFRRGESHPVRLLLPPEEIEWVRGLFEEAAFFDLEDRYLDEPPRDVLIWDLRYHAPDRGKRVVAQEDLAPEALARLVGELRGLIDRIVATSPGRPAIVGSVSARPFFGGPSVPRTLTLSLVNRSEEPETLRFADGQMFDLAVLGRCTGCGPGGGGGGGHHGGDHPGDGHHPGCLVWNWAFDRDFIQATTQLVLQPDEVHEFEVTWGCVTNEGAPVAPGPYRVVGIVAGHPGLPVRPAELFIDPTPPPLDKLALRAHVEPRDGPVGSSRELHLVVRNVTDQPITLYFPDDQHRDFHISDPRRMRPTPLWSWSYGKGFTDFPTEIAITPAEEIEFTERWDGRTNDGAPVGPGHYTVEAVLATRDPRRAPIVWFRVTD